MTIKRTILRARRKKRVRAKIYGTLSRPRLSVFRSHRYIYAQIINDEEGKTLLAASEKELDTKSAPKETRIEKARRVGQILAQKALAAKIKTVVFNRGGYRYHGRVKALAEGAREGGLSF
ncbi:MAG: 50S ribosomal protein L18 [bacterium]|nr:50S ribosomal protein L18 [bacterium]